VSARVRHLAAVALLLATAATAFAAEPSPWDRAIDPATGARFIPVELWTGGDWDGSHVIRLLPASLKFGRDKRLEGPVAWTPPYGGAPILVYERVQSGKRQLFALAPDGTGLGRVYDSRYPRYCPGEVKFPLGYWKEGEVRDYTLACDGGKSRRTLRVTIEALDVTYATVPHSLRFHWLMDGGRGRGTDMRYVYSPGLGLVHVQGNE
jgi:hypothetical protein